MYNYCKNVAPLVAKGRLALRPAVTLQARNNFWSLPRPGDFRLMLRDVDRQMDRLEREMQGFFRHSPISSLLPRMVTVPVEAVETAGNTYRINIDVSGFKPEDIKLALKDKVLTIEAKMEQKGEDGSRLYQEMSRAYTLPESIDVANLKSLLTTDGVLAIEAPLVETEAAKPQEIPIERKQEIADK